MVLLSAAAFAGMLMVTAICLFLVNEVGIGGTAYKTIINNKNTLENIALLKSDLFQINSEVHNFMVDTDKGARVKQINSIKELSGAIDRKFGIVLASVESPAKRGAIDKAVAIWGEYKKTLIEEVLPAAGNGNALRAHSLMTGIQAQRFGIFSKTVATMVDDIRRDVKQTEETVSAGIRTKILVSVLITLLVIGLIALFSIFITKSITTPLRACVEFARTVAAGRLDTRLDITTGSEIGDLATAMNVMAENLNSMFARVSSVSDVLISIDNNIERASRHVVTSARLQESAVGETSQAVKHINESVSDVSEGIDKLSSSASETSSSILEMAASIEEVAMNADKLGESVNEVSSSVIEMAASIKEIGTSIVNLLDASSTTASSIAEMDATIKQVEKNAMDTSSISEGVKLDAETGKKAVEEAIAGMQAIRTSSHITAEVIENLSLRANDIGAILSVIDEVAEQTNLLALNAAIIAAQAGEHGKGFAVVADEIRELAERTSSSTREIGTVIQGVQDETRRAVSAISQAEESITEGEKLSQRSGAALEKIVSGVQKASIQVHEIARATVEQARGSQSIREAMERVEEMVGQIANSSLEHSRGSDLITSAVERMKNLTMQVRTSTREQSRASGLIARSTEDIITMIDQIREACNSQVKSSAMISKAVVNIQVSSNSNSEAAKVMEGSVTGLSKQIEYLEKEMSGFKV
ncbi:MAG: HAMP domain-containing protein [Deltaproteobacteria bacterium]|nr:HAMP domain-containing protein [Deltaproteobacteria bacterium]